VEAQTDKSKQDLEKEPNSMADVLPSLLTRRTFLEGIGVSAAVVVPEGHLGALTTVLAGTNPVAYRPRDPSRKVRIGVVGGGFGADFQWHLHPNCVVHAVSDLRPDRRAHLMQAYKCNRSYESLEKLLLDKEIDAVAIFTEPPNHVRHCVAVMNSGKHVICAVPACMSLEEAQELKDTKKRTGRIYMMAETSYYRAHTILARELFQQGKFGEIFYSEVEYYHPYKTGGRQL
jgi:hypothetical protein